MNVMNGFLERELFLLSRKSIFSRFLIWLKRVWGPDSGDISSVVDDQSSLLESSPLGTFIYNLRALFIIGGIVFLLSLTLLGLAYQTDSEGVKLTLYLLWPVLFLAIIIALMLNRDLRKNLLDFQKKDFVGLYSIFEKYFFIDAALVTLATIVGKYILEIPVESLIFLVMANLFVHSIYVVGDKTKNIFQVSFVNSLILPFTVVPALITWFVLLTINTDARPVPQLFHSLLLWGPILGSVWVSIISISTISYLRKKELTFSENTMAVLVTLVASITDPLAEKVKDSNNIVSDGITSLLKNICSTKNSYGYRAARVWELVKAIKDEISQNVDDDLVWLASYSTDTKFQFPKVDAQNLPTAISPTLGSYTSSIAVPIRHNNLQTGFLELYLPRKILLTQHEAKFLQSVSEIIHLGYQLFKAKQEMLALDEVDNILDCESLDQAYQNATILLHKYLSAQGSMLLLKEKGSKKLKLIASEGFNRKYLDRNDYEVGRGLTGRCAEKGELILVNDVQNHLRLFDEDLLSNVEGGLGSKVVSWMAIPIGEKDDVLGLVKVVNKKTGASKWYTDFDQGLARELASRLKVVLDKFIHLEDIREAQQRALERAKAADLEKQKAEKLAKDRQQDLITLSHQLLTPLNANIGRISLMLEDNRLFSSLRTRLEFCNSLLFDAQDQIMGILIATSRESGQKIYVSKDKVVAQEMTKAIYERMRKTGNRPDLRFEYKEGNDFPILTIDKRLFSSVLYSLIHNATKYADKGSVIKLECGFEWSLLDRNVRHPAIKVKSIGPPIMFSEREKIFERFYRGQSVSNTGIYKEPGIGLGLWVARNLMWEAGGDITLEVSNENSRLSIFVIHFPGD